MKDTAVSRRHSRCEFYIEGPNMKTKERPKLLQQQIIAKKEEKSKAKMEDLKESFTQLPKSAMVDEAVRRTGALKLPPT